MIDFKDCPVDSCWYLWDSDGNSKLLTNEVEFSYARLMIAKFRLNGYYLTRNNDKDSEEKYPINHYGCVRPYPIGLFESTGIMAGDIIRCAMETKRIESEEDDYDE